MKRWQCLRQTFISILLFTLIPLNAKAFPPPSPAGGNYLVLDGVDAYAVLDFEAFGILLPEGTDEFTVEAWVYPTAEKGGAKTGIPLAVKPAGKLTTTWGQLKR